MTVYKNGAVIENTRGIALGFFDGVHIGHRKILAEARAEADGLGIPLAVFTFSLDASIKDEKRIYTEDERLFLFEECGVDEIIIASFSDMKELSGESFVNEFLIEKYGCTVCVVGEDFRFGRGAAYDADRLSLLMAWAGRKCITVDDVTIEGKRVSTTEIKEYLSAGDIDKANRALGSPYLIISTVTHGRGVGKTLGFPTLNCDIGGQRPIRHGVYASSVIIKDKEYPALTNIGICPTFDLKDAHAETFILDFSGDIYDERVIIRLHAFLRDEMRFDSAKSLCAAINNDINTAKEFFKNGR